METGLLAGYMAMGCRLGCWMVTRLWDGDRAIR